MKFLLGCNVKISLIRGGEKEHLVGDKNLVGWRESTRRGGGIFSGEEMSKFLATWGESPFPSPPAGKTLFILDI